MRLTIDNKTYYRPINLSFNLSKIHRKLCSYAVVLVMFYAIAIMAWRCF